MINRPPVVAILGHVDHGKTTLLDYIRKSHLTEKEIGGITQKIGAYEIDTKIAGYKNTKITFIDTPGHEAFSKLRARGAAVADIALLLTEAKDSVMPQTIESISHIKNAQIPYIVVINKIDLPEANPEKVKNDLMKYDVLVEGKGGDAPVVEISAKTGKGISELLETILLLSAEKNLTYDPKNSPKTYIIETKKDKRGVIASVIIKDGKLSVGDIVYIGEKPKKIRAMVNDLGKNISFAQPSTPFELLGFNEMPEVGDLIQTTPVKQSAISHQPLTIPKKIDLATFLQPETTEKKLFLILKANSQGSLEAISDALIKTKNIEIILKAVGDINKSDVFLAKTTKAIIVGFSVVVSSEIRDLVKQEKAIIKTYNIIYKLLEELAEVSKLLIEKQEKEKTFKGEAKILAAFIIQGEKVYGIKVTKGKINLGDPIEVYRNDKFLGKIKSVSLKIKAKKVVEVKKDQEAGIIFNPSFDITIGDMIKSIL